MCGKAPKAPPPPEPKAQELAYMEKQGKAIDQYLSSIEEQKTQNKELGLLTAVSSGLYDPVYKDGKLVDATLNQQRISDLRSDIDRSRNIGLLQADRYEKALRGELPVSTGTTQKKQDEFKLLKEGLARRGVNIYGDSPETASSDSTAGNEALGQFNRTYGLIEDAERRGELSIGQPVNLGVPTLSLATSSGAYGPGTTASGYGTAAGLLGAAQQPYQLERSNLHNTQLLNAQLRSQQRAGYFQLGAGALGLGAGVAASKL